MIQLRKAGRWPMRSIEKTISLYLLGLSIYLEHPLHSEVPRAEIKP